MPSPSIKESIQHVVDSASSDSDYRYLQYRFPLNADDILPLFAAVDSDYEKSFYWEIPDENTALVGFGSVAEQKSAGTARFYDSEEAFTSLQEQIAVVGENAADKTVPTFLFLNSFFDEIAPSEWTGFSPSLLYLPKFMMARQGPQITGCINFKLTPESKTQTILEEIRTGETLFRRNFSSLLSLQNGTIQLAPYLNGEKSQWLNSVSRGIESIRHHEIEKVVLAKKSQIAVREYSTLYETLDTLRNSYPGCVTFMYKQDEKAFFGATPEWLARVQDNILTCDALAGSIGRDSTPQIDEELGEELLHSPKNLSEHKFVVQYLKRKLQTIADNIDCPDSPELKKLENVQHLYTKIIGELQPDITPFDIVEKLHPTPAVGGIPSKDALSFIRTIEHLERGYYAAPLGWISLGGDFDIAVGLRSGLLTKDTLHLYAGAGIVEGSDPEAEYDELQLKLMPLLTAFQSVAVHE